MATKKSWSHLSENGYSEDEAGAERSGFRMFGTIRAGHHSQRVAPESVEWHVDLTHRLVDSAWLRRSFETIREQVGLQRN